MYLQTCETCLHWHLIQVNSSWTKGHIDEIWEAPARTHIIYPPCDFSEFQKFPVVGRQRLIISIGQFRPEKNHPLQLLSFHKYLTELRKDDQETKLIIIGGCRNEEDRQRVSQLKEMAQELEISVIQISRFCSSSILRRIVSNLSSMPHSLILKSIFRRHWLVYTQCGMNISESVLSSIWRLV